MIHQQQKSGAHRLFDHLIAVHQLKNDAALVRKLDVAPSVISKARNGVVAVSAALTLNIHETFGMPVADIRNLISGAA